MESLARKNPTSGVERNVAYLQNFRPLPCGVPLAQSRSIDWLKRALREATGSHSSKTEKALELYDRLADSSHIQFRSSLLPDYYETHPSRMQLYREWEIMPGKFSPWFSPPLEKRTDFFETASMELARAAFHDEMRQPQYLVQVSCTGYSSPHAIQKVSAEKSWGRGTHLLHIGHMGCYAAIPTVGMSERLLTSEKDWVGLLLVELCTLHLKPGAFDQDQIIINTLFSDGAIRVDISQTLNGPGLELVASTELLIPETNSQMTWKTADSAFSMTLSPRVPILIAREIKNFLSSFLAERGLTFGDVGRHAIHPGGPKIIDVVGEALQLSEASIQHSRRVLAARGNMSSCSLPHIWSEILEDSEVQYGEYILSVAFGPGLTIAANLLRKLK